MKKLLFISVLSLFAINMVGAQTINTESSVLKVASVSVYSDTYNYTFGNPIKLNGNRKSGFASGVMSFFIPGLGQFYNGDELGGCAYILANVLTKVWLACPPTKQSTYGYGSYSYAYEDVDYTIPVIANILVTVASVVDAVLISKRVNDARDGYRVGGSTLKIEPTIIQSNTALGYGYNDLAYGLNCSLKF